RAPAVMAVAIAVPAVAVAEGFVRRAAHAFLERALARAPFHTLALPGFAFGAARIAPSLPFLEFGAVIPRILRAIAPLSAIGAATISIIEGKIVAHAHT